MLEVLLLVFWCAVHSLGICVGSRIRSELKFAKLALKDCFRRKLPRSPSSALCTNFLGEGSPTKIDYRTKGTLILTSLLEDLASLQNTTSS